MDEGWPGPGVVFGMPESQYLASGGLSKSAAVSLEISPLDFWARSAMNPDREELADTIYTELGSAYHKRIVEGPAAFLNSYVEEPEKADYPGLLVTMEDLREACDELGVKPGRSKETAIAALREAGYEGPIWDEIMGRFKAALGGRTPIERKMWKRIQVAAAMIEKHPHLSGAFAGGYPEVSIFWRHEATGCPMRARLDYLKMRAIVDLKSFGNQRGRPFDREVAYVIGQRRYYLQAAIYIDAVRAAKRMWREKSGAFVVAEGASHPSPEWLDKWAAQDMDPQFVFVFQQTGVAPVARGYVLPAGNVMAIGQAQYEAAAAMAMDYYSRFGADPWIDDSPIRTLDDTEFPAWLGE